MTADSYNLFERELNPYQRKIYSHVLNRLAEDFVNDSKHKRTRRQQLRGNETEADLLAGVHFLVEFVDRQIAVVLQKNAAQEDFQRRYRLCSNLDDQRQTILDFAEYLGGTASSLASDTSAFERFFDFDAVVERHTRRTAESEQTIAFSCETLGRLVKRYLHQVKLSDAKSAWQALNAERLLQTVLTTRFDHRVHHAAFRCLNDVTNWLPVSISRGFLTVETTALTTQTANDANRPTWNQCEAMDLLLNVAPATFRSIARKRLSGPEAGDDLFVRRRIVRAIALRVPSDDKLLPLAKIALTDTSDFVRQAVARIYVRLKEPQAMEGLRQLVRHDTQPRVRAAAIVEGSVLIDRPELQIPFATLMAEVLEHDRDPFVVRTAMHTLCRWAQMFAVEGQAANDIVDTDLGGKGQAKTSVEPELTTIRELSITHWPELRSLITGRILSALMAIRQSGDSVPMKRVAANASEQLWLFCDESATRLYRQLKDACGSVDSGSCRSVSKKLLQGFEDDVIGRILAVLAQEDFAFEIEQGFFTNTVSRGYLFRFRFWRLWHEMMTPSPDKRQAFSHIHGRASYASLRAPSGILAELSETKVPGEPLFIADEGGWRPYLPLADDVLSTLNQIGISRPVRFYTAEGVTIVQPPKWFFQRAVAWLKLSLRFSRFARMRNWTPDGGGDPDAYLKAIRKLGIKVTFQPYPANPQSTEPPVDESVLRFFPKVAACFALPILFGQTWVRDFKTYFTSVYENSLSQLMVFTTVSATYFFLKHVYTNHTLRKARNQICLSIGGWGTRGKSGTERLKAALLNALGYSITSKSSGCEAMFLYAPTYGRLREYILYRPYDKATIWEHRNVILLAAKLKSQMFIWECMGLTPAYVDVLQKQWTRDDLNTITNTFPDHEDLQGPAGINVAETISQFVAKKSTVITTEQQMRPILTQESRRQQSRLIGVGWLESGLLTDDVLDRFPYTEHPDNIALVQRMAMEMGIDPDYAVKQMSDQMIPDLGVLLTSPPAEVDGRTLVFTNGCSANERLGCMGNWNRLGFATQDHINEPNVWVSTVVNNRADRIARSQVFARILVHDVSADRHFLIGNNLKGFQGYVKEAWAEYIADVTLWKDDEADNEQAAERWRKLARRFRQYTTEEQIAHAMNSLATGVLQSADGRLPDVATADCWQQPKQCEQALIAAGASVDLAADLREHHEFLLHGFHEFHELLQKLLQASQQQRAEVTREAFQLLWQWYERKFVVIDDYFATGEQVVCKIAQTTPPGMTNRIIGLQNIKGTGLDFVYRWQAWQNCHEICSRILSDDVGVMDAGIQRLSEFQDYGLLSEKRVRSAIQHARKSAASRRESTLGQLDMIEANVDRAMERIRGTLNSGPRKSGVTDKLVEWLEEFLDVTDAIRRRKESDVIYRDLANEQISQERALLELRAINKRQKGGWVSKKLKTMFQKTSDAA